MGEIILGAAGWDWSPFPRRENWGKSFARSAISVATGASRVHAAAPTGEKNRPISVQTGRNSLQSCAGRTQCFSGKPIFRVQAADTLELVDIGGHDRGAGRIGVRGDEQIVAADWLSGRFEF